MAKRKPYISPANMKKRLEFAKKYQFEEESYWQHVFFTDESKFNLSLGSNAKVRVLCLNQIQPQAVRKLDCLRKARRWQHHGPPGVFRSIDEIMDAARYREPKNLRQSAEKLGIAETVRFYQDNDPKQKAYLTCEWLFYNCPKVIGRLICRYSLQIVTKSKTCGSSSTIKFVNGQSPTRMS